ncbi:MAG: hypothetical protein NWF14_07285, partial [Candidatus Bathyarchaeota archaeon]|nr:hypothetical protein [Candidatus Bathyarchaeota archaeon]
MKVQTIDVVSLFNQAWVELYCPPVRLTLEEEENLPNSKAKLTAVNGIVHLKPDIVPRRCDPGKYLLWTFRHELAHVHHCPYDIKTAYSLERAAHNVVGSWNLAYLATHIFSDVQVDLNYLPRRFGELPYFARLVGYRSRSLPEQIMQEIYLWVHQTAKSKHKDIAETAKEILAITSLDRTWHTKVQMIAYILRKLWIRNPRLLSEKRIAKYIKNNPLHVREDFLHSSLGRFTETYGSISNERAARDFFKQWVEPRLSKGETEKIKEMIKKKLKTQGTGRKMEGEGAGIKKDVHKLEKSSSSQEAVSGKEPFRDMFGVEPRL